MTLVVWPLLDGCVACLEEDEYGDGLLDCAAASSSAEPVSFCTKCMKPELLACRTVVGTFFDGRLRFFFSVVPFAGLAVLETSSFLPAMMQYVDWKRLKKVYENVASQ